MTTSYDQLAYPAGIFPQTLPARLAVLGMIHGLTPALPRHARVLEVGGGSCMNLIAMAAAWPEARFVGFDLAESAIAVGKAMIAKAGLTNIELFTGDICEVAKAVEPGGFDYIIAHGVYAWVPDFVREALLELYGRGLSENGMGFISYNALPGCYVRMIMRDRLLDGLEGVEGIEPRIAAGRALLEDMANSVPDGPIEGGSAIHHALKQHAQSMLNRPPSVLFHDELGEVFAPQRLKQVVADAARHGLRFLTDAGRNLNLHGFLPPDAEAGGDDEQRLVHNLQLEDNEVLRYFRQTLFVRSTAKPDRRMSEAVTGRLANLWVSCNMTPNEDGSFQHGEERLELASPELAKALVQVIAAYPAALRVGDLLHSHDARGGLLQLFAEWYLELRHDPPPFATALSERPEFSPLVRAIIAMGDRQMLTLNHTMVAIDQADLRALFLAADGTRTVEELRALDHGIPAEVVHHALATGLKPGLILR